MRRNRTIALAAALSAAGLVCGGLWQQQRRQRRRQHRRRAGKPLIISDVTGANWNCQFNPLSTNWPEGGPSETGVIYEPLMFVNALQTGTQASAGIHPWLATGYSWNSNLTALTFTIRKGVKFSDGTPMTPADVAFSFNVLKENGALDLQSLWKAEGGPLTSVTTSGDTVTLNFDAPSPTYFYYAAGRQPILPEHIWSKIPASKMPTYPDNHPVGTGAYVVGSCSSTNLIYKANPHYWQPGKPAVKTVEWPAYLDNTTGNNCLINGQCQWGGQYIPNISQTYIAKNPSAYHNWAPSVSSVTLDINLGLKNSPLDNVRVRQAMALAINRDQVGAIGETGSEGAAFQDGVAASFRSGGWVDQAQAQLVLQRLRVQHNGSRAPPGPGGLLQDGRWRPRKQRWPEARLHHGEQRRLLRLGGRRHRHRPATREGRHSGHASQRERERMEFRHEPGPLRPRDQRPDERSRP